MSGAKGMMCFALDFLCLEPVVCVTVGEAVSDNSELAKISGTRIQVPDATQWFSQFLQSLQSLLAKGESEKNGKVDRIVNLGNLSIDF